MLIPPLLILLSLLLSHRYNHNHSYLPIPNSILKLISYLQKLMNINPLLQQEEDNTSIDTLVINICAIVSFFIPIIGFIYFACFRLSNFHNHHPKKKRALSFLLFMSTAGLFWQTILIILMKTHVIPSPF